MYFRNIIRIYFRKNRKKDELMLGRWNYPINKKNLDRKIYLANYDHCGTCGNIIIDDNNLTVSK